MAAIRRDVVEHCGLVAQDGGRVVGFVTWKYHYPTSVEISWLAVARDRQRQGVGRELITAMERRLRQDGKVRIVEVKTLAETVEYEPYRLTREFYEGVGFIPLEILPTYWNLGSPAKVYVKPLRPSSGSVEPA